MGATLGCSDRGHTAVSQLKPGDIDWETIFGKRGVRWFHTGGIFCALADTTPDVALEAMQSARKHGTVISYDLNYRESLWKGVGGNTRAQEVNRRLAPYVDVMLGNEEDFSAALGFEVAGLNGDISNIDTQAFKKMIERVTAEFSFKAVATTLRHAKTRHATIGQRSATRTGTSTNRRCDPTSKSTTVLAAVTRSLPA